MSRPSAHCIFLPPPPLMALLLFSAIGSVGCSSFTSEMTVIPDPRHSLRTINFSFRLQPPSPPTPRDPVPSPATIVLRAFPPHLHLICPSDQLFSSPGVIGKNYCLLFPPPFLRRPPSGGSKDTIDFSYNPTLSLEFVFELYNVSCFFTFPVSSPGDRPFFSLEAFASPSRGSPSE